MKIDITKEQYKQLIPMLAIASGVVGILGDVLPEMDYKKRSLKMEELEKYFMQYADEFGCGEFLDEEFYENKVLPIMSDFEDYSMHDNLSSDLAWRDFRKKYSEKEMKKMAEKNGGVAISGWKYMNMRKNIGMSLMNMGMIDWRLKSNLR